MQMPFHVYSWITGIVTAVGDGTNGSSPLPVTMSGTVLAGIVAVGPSSAPAAGIAPVAGNALASSLVAKNAAGNFYGANINMTGTAGWVMLFDAAAVPADGAVTPLKAWQVSANSTLELGYLPAIKCLNGIVLVFSTTGPFNKTASATAFFSADVA